jgi:ubiquinone/menaquinone biosynthesis C-methylase UbiE
MTSRETVREPARQNIKETTVNQQFWLGVAVGLAAAALIRSLRRQGYNQARLDAYYQRRAKDYNQTDQLNILGRYPRLEMRREVMRLADLKPGQKVLDFACGAGANFPYILERIGPTGKLVGVDYSADMLAEARRLVEASGWPNVELIQADAAAMQPGADFDVALSTLGLVVIPRWEEAMQRAWEALKPGGRYAIADLCASERWYARPIGFIMEVMDILIVTDTARRPWEWLAAQAENYERREIFHGFFYAAAGDKPQ